MTGLRNTLRLIIPLALAQVALAEERGVLGNAASGELRKEKSADAPIVATVEPGDVFSFEPDEDYAWGKVTLDSGRSGWLPLDRVRLFYDESDLPEKDPSGLSEIDEAAKSLGFDYVKVTRKAAQGDARALKHFFSIAQHADGAAAESLTSVPTAVYHVLGDGKFAKFLSTQSVEYRSQVRNIILGDGRLPPTALYLKRHFPETAKVFFPGEIVAWPSPDGRYVIRKVFSDAFDLRTGKIARTELLEKKTGRVVLDMTAEDIGTGSDRECAIVWSPDSKRFASLSVDQTPQVGNLFSTPRPAPLRKQTVVYQLTGESWERVDLHLDNVPGREKDSELEGAILGHDYIEPVRWKKPNVLLLERHEYYEKIKPIVAEKMTFNSIVGFGRWYDITATITPEGKATLVWKLKDDR